jgi:hypothetical protein
VRIGPSNVVQCQVGRINCTSMHRRPGNRHR